MPRNLTKPRKPYEKRVDLTPYQRLLRCLRWMSPELTTVAVLRMFPYSDGWSSSQLQRYAADLDRYVTRGGDTSLPALVPWVAIGAWGWPVKTREIEGHEVLYWEEHPGCLNVVRPPGLPHVWLLAPGLPMSGLERGEPVLMDGQFPTGDGLCHLANELKDILSDLIDTDDQRIRQRYGEDLSRFPPDFTQNGEMRAILRLGPRVRGRVSPRVRVSYPSSSDRSAWHIEEAPDDYEFASYCYWLLLQLIRDGHGWRVACCDQCHGFFVKPRRDPSDRPSRFCGEVCRRAWHNPRRPKKGSRDSQATE
jgi:hypothetical protein